MIKLYDYDNAFLHLDSGRDFIFDLQLRPEYTVLTGKSGTGRTLIVNSVLEYIDFIKKEYNDSVNIRAFKSAFGINDIEDAEKSLIIVDDADDYMTRELTNFIRWQRGNHFLFMSRRPFGLDISPSHIGELYDENGVIRIHYEFEQLGWG